MNWNPPEEEMVKAIEFPGILSTGELAVQVLPTAGSHEKTAGAVHPDIHEFQRSINPGSDDLYVLNIAMGAEEIWDENLNGDGFPRQALKHKPGEPARWSIPGVAPQVNQQFHAYAAKIRHDYGGETFYRAGIFRNHKNKDAALSQGEIALVIYNERMDRVEVVQKRSIKKMLALGYSDTLEKLRSGTPVPVSMGCRVPADLCVWCMRWARNRSEYCLHALRYMNQVADSRLINDLRLNRPEWVMLRGGRILYPGTRMYVQNWHPRLFDLSDVVINADPTAYATAVLEKAAAASASSVLSVDRALEFGMGKTAAGRSWKGAALSKSSTMEKETPALSPAFIAERLADEEPDLPDDMLKGCGSKSLKEVLSALTTMGVVLKPAEFQQLVLRSKGKANLADALLQVNGVFKPEDDEEDLDIGNPGSADSDTLRKLVPWMGERSMHKPFLHKRITIVITRKGHPARKHGPSKVSADKVPAGLGAELRKTAALYNGYVRAVMSRFGEFESAAAKHAGYGPLILEEKTAAIGLKGTLAMMTPILYLMAKAGKDAKDAGAIRKFVGHHPVIASSLLAGAAKVIPMLLR
jgi:hypothetical protein